MAEMAAKENKMASKSENPQLEKEANDRLADCRLHKAEWERDMREVYFFAAPHRSRSVNSGTQPTAKPQDAGESNTSFAAEMATDFATVMMNTFMPEAEQWAGRICPFGTPPAVIDAVKDQIKKDDKTIFGAIGASNFYAECSTAFIPDLAVGIVAMWIDQDNLDIATCQAIPLHELEVSTGPNGQIDDRFFVQHVKLRKIKSLIPDIQFPQDIEERITRQPNRYVELRRGFWRLWDERDDVYWQYVVLINSRLID